MGIYMAIHNDTNRFVVADFSTNIDMFTTFCLCVSELHISIPVHPYWPRLCPTHVTDT